MNVSTIWRMLFYAKEGVPVGGNIPQWQNKCRWWRQLGQSGHWMAGSSEWVNAPVLEYRQITLTHTSSKMDSSFGYLYSIIHDKFRYYKICVRWMPMQRTDKRKQACMEMCIQIMGMFLCEGLSQAVKHRCTTINLHTNAKDWSGSTHHHPD